MREPFKVGELVVTELTGDVIKITNIDNIRKGVFGGVVIKHIRGEYSDRLHYAIGFHSDHWWIPVFKLYTGVIRITKLKII